MLSITTIFNQNQIPNYYISHFQINQSLNQPIVTLIHCYINPLVNFHIISLSFSLFSLLFTFAFCLLPYGYPIISTLTHQPIFKSSNQPIIKSTHFYINQLLHFHIKTLVHWYISTLSNSSPAAEIFPSPTFLRVFYLPHNLLTYKYLNNPTKS